MSKFRQPTSNKRYTVQLFYETSINLAVEKRMIEPMFSLHQDVKGLINMRKEYVRDGDPTGYKTATRLLENYDHWLLLMRTSWFAEAKKVWDVELASKMDSEAVGVLTEIMRDTEGAKTSERISAARILLGKAKTIGKEDKVSQRGRPSKEEIEGNLKVLTREEKTLQDDLSRIRAIK